MRRDETFLLDILSATRKAMNPCPCGYQGDPTASRNYTCSREMVTRYQKETPVIIGRFMQELP